MERSVLWRVVLVPKMLRAVRVRRDATQDEFPGLSFTSRCLFVCRTGRRSPNARSSSLRLFAGARPLRVRVSSVGWEGGSALAELLLLLLLQRTG